MPADAKAPAPRLTSANTAPQAPAPPAVPSVGVSKPGQTNTGVPAGTALKAHYGDMHITTAGLTLDALDIHGFVFVEAPNVTIKRSIIRGGKASSGNIGLVNSVDARVANFRLLDSELVPAYPSVYLDGIKGWSYTLLRVNIHGTVDSAKVFGNNVLIQSSWLHGSVYYASDPNQGGGHTHNDGVQVLKGSNIRILNNTINGAYNSAMQVTQGNGAVNNLWFNGNWADGGGCTVNMASIPLASLSGVTLNSNRFGRATRVPNCPMLATFKCKVSAAGNVYDSTGQAVRVRYA